MDVRGSYIPDIAIQLFVIRIGQQSHRAKALLAVFGEKHSMHLILGLLEITTEVQVVLVLRRSLARYLGARMRV